MGQFTLYLASNASYVGQPDLLLLITYWAIPEDQIETIAKLIHKVQLGNHWKSYLGQHDLIRYPMLKVSHLYLIKVKFGSFGF